MRKVDLTRSFAPVHTDEVYIHQAGLGEPTRFDVTKAWRIVDGWTAAQRSERFAIREVARFDLETHSLDTVKAMSADLGVPVLWVTVTETSPATGEPYTWTRMIDGYSRAYKSLMQKRGLKLPAFVLTADESASCRITAQPKKRRGSR